MNGNEWGRGNKWEIELDEQNDKDENYTEKEGEADLPDLAAEFNKQFPQGNSSEES